MTRRLPWGTYLPLLACGASILYACGSNPGAVPGWPDGSAGDASSGGSSGETPSDGSTDSSGGSGGGSSGGSSGAGSSSGNSSGGKVADSGAGTDGAVPDSGSTVVGDGGPANPVLQQHTNASRDGVYIDSVMTKTVAATLKVDTTFAPTINGNVYAQPLYVPNGPGGNEAFIVATETNHVTAISGTGAIVWDHTYGTPATSATLPCGNISPLGVTGTPIVDMPSRTIFFDAMTNSGGTLDHMIHAVSLDDGTEKTGWPVDVNASVSGFDSSHQNERGALALVNGVVYVPYGGHLGDCGAYHGWVIGVPIANPATVTAWSTGSIGMVPEFKGGIWSHGGIASDGTGLFVSTGNTSTSTASGFTAPTTWSGGEAVFRFTAGPTYSSAMTDFYYPSDWASMDNSDSDLGGANPVVFDIGTTHYVAALGKDGNLYLLNRDNLGGMGGQISTTLVSGLIIGSPTVYTTSQATYIAFRGSPQGCPSGQTGNVGAVKIANGAKPTIAWCSTQANLGSPMVTTTGTGTDVVVWDASTRLYGYNGDTGAVVFAGGSTGDVFAAAMQYMNTPIGAGRSRMAVATSGHLYLLHP